MKWQWIVSFNDGQRVSSKTLLEEDSTRNPWTGILNYLRKNPKLIDGKDREITHLELIVNSKRYNSPSKSPHALFQSSSEEPFNFWVFYKNFGTFGQSSNDENFVGISFRIGDYRIINWVSEKTDSSIIQTINTVNPTTKKDKEFYNVEHSIVEEYNTIYGGNFRT